MDWKTCFQGKKILVVEDDSVNRDLMNDVLTLMQCQVEFATNADEAIDKASKQIYDLIFMDILMPGKDGMQTAKEIKALTYGSQNTPIIAVTAAVTESRDTIMQSGMQELVYKPINLEQLRNTMAKILLR